VPDLIPRMNWDALRVELTRGSLLFCWVPRGSLSLRLRLDSLLAPFCLSSRLLASAQFLLADLSHNDTVHTAHISTPSQIRRRILWIQTFTVVWMTAEGGVALASAWKARSPALLGFGGDSLIELLSAAVVFWRFRDPRVDERTEERTAQIAGIVVIASAAALLGYCEVRTSPIGLVLLLLAAIVMPWLASQKRLLAEKTGSRALRERTLRNPPYAAIWPGLLWRGWSSMRFGKIIGRIRWRLCA